MQKMQNDLEETIIAALMCDLPVVIVEGQDDIKFYDNVASCFNLKIDVRSIETISEYTEGCEQVCEAMQKTQKLIENDSRLKEYVIGIIDRDVRYYLNTIPQINNLLVLKYYSYETHLITDKTIGSMLELLTMVPRSMITQKVIDYLKEDFNNQVDELYYFSLEALKKMCQPSYENDFAYGLKGGAVLGKSKNYKWPLVKLKIAELNEFAEKYNISKHDLKCIAKGKWYISYWCDYLCRKSKDLKALCGVELPKCKYCEAGQNEKCLWRIRSSFQHSQLESFLYTKEFIDVDEVKYIYDYMHLHLKC